jgi:hypothetical protein
MKDKSRYYEFAQDYQNIYLLSPSPYHIGLGQNMIMVKGGIPAIYG